MSRQKMILLPSSRMDNNRKEDRNENGLVRMSKSARAYMDFEDKVELYPVTKSTEQRLNGSVLLDIFHAFSSDIKEARATGLSDNEMRRVGFVTSQTFAKITGKQDASKENIWITDNATDTVLGADPEFLLFGDSGNIIRANNVLSYNGAIGCDGAMAEVRPKPAMTPEGLVANIKVLFEDDKLVKAIRQYKWMPGCYYKDANRDYPIGGHIHVGNPTKIARMTLSDRTYFFMVFNKIMDQLLSVPMVKIDGKQVGKARRTECQMGKFGYFGAFRTCNGHFEHRTLSGMWLMHPELATAVFGTAKAIVDEVYSYVAEHKFKLDYMYPKTLKMRGGWPSDQDSWGAISQKFNKWSEIPLLKDLGCTDSSEKIMSILHNSDANKITLKYLRGWYDSMRKMSSYKKYSRYVDDLYEVLKVKTKQFHNYNRELQKTWLEGDAFLK